MTKFILILLGMGIVAQSALAMSETAVEIDTNGDGLVTVDEVQAVFPEITADTFAAVDTNNDGALDDAEMIAGQEQGLLPTSIGG